MLFVPGKIDLFCDVFVCWKGYFLALLRLSLSSREGVIIILLLLLLTVLLTSSVRTYHTVVCRYVVLYVPAITVPIRSYLHTDSQSVQYPLRTGTKVGRYIHSLLVPVVTFNASKQTEG